MLYHTYRPKRISELDNKHVKDTISNILQSQQVPHAFLFVGQKGMGKTSTARIVAKAVNCLKNKFAGKGSSIEPCNDCDNCKAIDNGHSPDVIEQDAGARGLKEEMLDLIREASFSPIVCRYRIFILDEAHMISTAAFNALLKTLEEPPAHVLFIFATTNEEKVPRTIVSRCIRVHFGKAKYTDIETMLQRILDTEQKKLDPTIVRFIAENADFSFRDATKMLEETLMQGIGTLAEAQTYFGIRSKHAFLKSLEGKDVKEALQWLHQFAESGGNAKLLLEESLRSLQEALLKKSGVETDGAPETSLSIKDIAHAMKLLTEAYTLLKVSPMEIIPLEIALVQFYNDRKL